MKSSSKEEEIEVSTEYKNLSLNKEEANTLIQCLNFTVKNTTNPIEESFKVAPLYRKLYNIANSNTNVQVTTT